MACDGLEVAILVLKEERDFRFVRLFRFSTVGLPRISSSRAMSWPEKLSWNRLLRDPARPPSSKAWSSESSTLAFRARFQLRRFEGCEIGVSRSSL
jgi:hypothetical protein